MYHLVVYLKVNWKIKACLVLSFFLLKTIKVFLDEINVSYRNIQINIFYIVKLYRPQHSHIIKIVESIYHFLDVANSIKSLNKNLKIPKG